MWERRTPQKIGPPRHERSKAYIVNVSVHHAGGSGRNAAGFDRFLLVNRGLARFFYYYYFFSIVLFHVPDNILLRHCSHNICMYNIFTLM